jgi:hypothetical protein
MLNSTNTLSPLNDRQSHPFSNLTNKEDKAKKIHRLLLDLARDESEKELKSVYRKTADFFREKVFGLTEAQIKSAILEVLEDYFDGIDYNAVEIDNISEVTGIKEKELLPVLNKMVAAGEILQGRRRRFQEFGEHYNAIYKLNK